MTFKRSLWWGFGGAVCISLLSLIITSLSKWLSDASTDLFLSFGLNPREETPECLLLFVAVTSVIGFFAGRGVRVRKPHADVRPRE